jgi:hypothetical protein
MSKLIIIGVSILVGLLVLGGITWGVWRYTQKQPVVKLPATINVKTGRLTKITADSSGAVKWFSCSGDVDLLPVDATSVIFCSDQPGSYTIMAYTASGNVPSNAAVCTVVVGGTPPGPTPPGPTPPGPTPPGPTPPGPVDPFVVTLTQAFAQDTSVDKAAKLQKLQSLWASAATTTANDTDITTVSQMVQVLHTAAANLIGTDLMTVRNAIKTELDTKLPTAASTPIDAATRQLCATQFKRVADALSKVK